MPTTAAAACKKVFLCIVFPFQVQSRTERKFRCCDYTARIAFDPVLSALNTRRQERKNPFVPHPSGPLDPSFLESNLSMKTFEQIADLEKRYLLGTYNRYPIVLTRGKGVFLYDPEDRRHLD
jgi:hypothetical protein